MTSLRFARIEEDGRSHGFDLDGTTTGEGDASGCGVPDQRGWDDESGIDNALGALIPVLELTEARAVESLLSDGIRSGDLLLLLEMAHVGDPEDDICVDLTLRNGIGTPLLSTQNEILPGQTFAWDPHHAGHTLEDLHMQCNTLTGTPITLDLPFQILGVDLEARLLDGAIQSTLRTDGGMSGMIGAGLDVDYLLEVARHPNVDPSIAPLLEELLSLHADLDPDGDGICEQISTSLLFEATQAWITD